MKNYKLNIGDECYFIWNENDRFGYQDSISLSKDRAMIWGKIDYMYELEDTNILIKKRTLVSNLVGIMLYEEL